MQLKVKIKKMHNIPAFYPSKDHKEGLHNKVECKFLNTIKSDLGKVAKAILEGSINSSIKNKTQLVQQVNSFEVIHWFKSLNDNKRKTFLKFDIVKLYQSIKPEELNKALTFAKTFAEFNKMTLIL